MPHSDSDHMRPSKRHSLILFRLFSHFLLLSLSIWRQMTSEWQNFKEKINFLPIIKNSHSLHLRVLDVKVDATLTLEERTAKDIVFLAKYCYSVFRQKIDIHFVNSSLFCSKWIYVCLLMLNRLQLIFK